MMTLRISAQGLNKNRTTRASGSYLQDLRSRRSEGRSGGRMPSKNLCFSGTIGRQSRPIVPERSDLRGRRAAPAPPPRKSCFLQVIFCPGGAKYHLQRIENARRAKILDLI